MAVDSVREIRDSFETDPYPGRPKILFVGLAESTHTHSWIGLLEGAEFNVRLFSTPTFFAPDDWKVRTYVTAYTAAKLDPATRRSFYSPWKVKRLAQRALTRLPRGQERGPERWLARVIREWKPDIIHTLGLDPAANFYHGARTRYGLAGLGKWVLQLRGGSDLTLTRHDPSLAPQIAEVLRACDQLVSDNKANFRYATEMGVRPERFSAISPVPGTGGIDVDALSRIARQPTSERRIILCSKGHEGPFTKVLPVYEALKMCWDEIQPCEIHLLSTNMEAVKWYRTLPEEIRHHTHVRYRVPRAEVLDLMARARVLLASSLIDGVPNSMYEGMAAGAFPIVSPLETIKPVVEDEENVLFARNLYPHEISDALVRAMNDDALVDAAAEKNLQLVRERADRAKIAPRVVAYYEDLAKGLNP